MASTEHILADCAINVRIAGDSGSPAVALIHGSGCDASVWDRTARRLMGEFFVVAIDLPGHGGTPDKADAPAGATRMSVYVDAVVAVIAELGLKKPVLAGHSLGSAVAMTVALDHPELPGGLALLGAGARLRVAPPVMQALRSDFEMALGLIGQVAFGPAAPPEASRAAADMMRKNGAAALLADFDVCDAFDVMDRLPEIRVPTVAICGEHDRLTPLKYSQYLSDNIPCKLVPIPGAGHMAQLENPDAVAAAIAELARSL